MNTPTKTNSSHNVRRAPAEIASKTRSSPHHSKSTRLSSQERIAHGPRLGPADSHSVTDLELSHTELRAAIRLAGCRIVQLNIGRRNDPLLGIMRRVLREANAVSRASRLAGSGPVGFRVSRASTAPPL
jgi:hypothetical protein